jgi:hypothetical protein
MEVLQQRLPDQHDPVPKRQYPAEKPDGKPFRLHRRSGLIDLYMRLRIQ